MIIVLSALAGGALFLGLSLWLGPPMVIALAAVAAVLVAIGVGSDVVRVARDRRTARRRLREMRSNDALNRILGEHRRG